MGTPRKSQLGKSALDSLNEATKIAQFARLTNLDWSQEPKDELEARIRKVYLAKQCISSLILISHTLRRYDAEGALLEELEPAKDLAGEIERKERQLDTSVAENASPRHERSLGG